MAGGKQLNYGVHEEGSEKHESMAMFELWLYL